MGAFGLDPSNLLEDSNEGQSGVFSVEGEDHRSL